MRTVVDKSLRGGLAASVLLLLAACSGTIQRDARIAGDAARVEGVTAVTVLMSHDANRQLAENPQFNRDELASFLRRRLEGKGLVAPAAAHRVEIVVTDIRVRSQFSAVMWGFMAGDDHVHGAVQLLGARGQPIRRFDIKASYAFGGWAGADGTRMSWLYDKFSELAAAELEKVVLAPAAAAVAAPLAATGVARTSRSLDDVDAVPGLDERGKAVYRDWLTRRPPRAFVIASDGRFNATWGAKPLNPADPVDPAERAMLQCQRAGRSGCTLYAVDVRLVYEPAVAPSRP